MAHTVHAWREVPAPLPRPILTQFAAIEWGGDGPDPLAHLKVAVVSRVAVPVGARTGSTGRAQRHSARRSRRRGPPGREGDDPEPPAGLSAGTQSEDWNSWESAEDRLLAYVFVHNVLSDTTLFDTLFDVKENVETIASLAQHDNVTEATIRQRVARALNKCAVALAEVGHPVPSRAVPHP